MIDKANQIAFIIVMGMAGAVIGLILTAIVAGLLISAGVIAKPAAGIPGAILLVGAALGAILFPILVYFSFRKEAEQKYREAQQGYRQQMIVLGEQLIGLFETMPNLLSSAEKYLDRAEADFADGAFAPFWDSIENAAKTLGRSNASKTTRLAIPI